MTLSQAAKAAKPGDLICRRSGEPDMVFEADEAMDGETRGFRVALRIDHTYYWWPEWFDDDGWCVKRVEVIAE